MLAQSPMQHHSLQLLQQEVVHRKGCSRYIHGAHNLMLFQLSSEHHSN